MLFRSDKKRAPEPGLRLYAAPPGRPFLTALAEALMSGNLPLPGGTRPSPLALADVTLMLPTRRDIRSLQEAFLKVSRGSAVLLPRIKLISDTSDDIDLTDDADGDIPTQGAIGKLERDLTLTHLVLAWSKGERGGARTPGQAVRLAKELSRLMDAVEIENVSLADIDKLVPDDLAAHWEQTLDFLKIVTNHWPSYLAERGLVSPAEHRKQLMLAAAERLRTSPPAAPVIVAGITGTVPAATELMRVVAGLPQGAVVLPALDRTLDDESWGAIVPNHPEHPQFGLKKLLDALGVPRGDVAPLPGVAAGEVATARWPLACESMRPAGTTERWHAYTSSVRAADMARARSGLAILDAPTAEQEAEAIALILRETAETPGRTAALVTPDRPLARRVAAHLESWDLQVEDAAGQPFGKTGLGAFLDLILEAVAQHFKPAALATLLKHPLCRLGLSAADLARGRRTLELAVFRAPYFGDTLDDLDKGLVRGQAEIAGRQRRHPAMQRLSRPDWDAAATLVRALTAALTPLQQLFTTAKRTGLQTLVRAHLDAAAALAGSRGSDGNAALWQGPAGEDASKLFAGMLAADAPYFPAMQGADYPEFYRSLIAEKSIAPRGGSHPRLFIWGPLEARLQQPDVVILGSLNEGVWPQAANPGPWLSRAMRQQLGLPQPEERIGQAAHDFTALLGADRVYLTRAAKVDGNPTVPSRWLLRLKALLNGVEQCATAPQPWLAWAAQRNVIAGQARPAAAPKPRPPVALRPRRLSVTAIETWIANPYAIFAQHILGLSPLPAIGEPPGPALRGQIVHAALGAFARAYPERLPDDIHAELMRVAAAPLDQLFGSPRASAFWGRRFERFAEWFAETEAERRTGVTRTLEEITGSTEIAAPAGPFKLTARADRVDLTPAGPIITDYKTGAGIKGLASRAADGRAPQLPLEAAIALAGGFSQVPAGPVAGLRYISASGGEPPGSQAAVGNGNPAALAEDARKGLEALIALFDRETTPYSALRRNGFRYDYDDFAHLARIAEWTVETTEEAE